MAGRATCQAVRGLSSNGDTTPARGSVLADGPRTPKQEVTPTGRGGVRAMQEKNSPPSDTTPATKAAVSAFAVAQDHKGTCSVCQPAGVGTMEQRELIEDYRSRKDIKSDMTETFKEQPHNVVAQLSPVM